MFERFSRSWDLMKASGAVLAADKELLLLPVMSGLAALLVVASFMVPALMDGWLQAAAEAQDPAQAAGIYLWAFAFYVVLYFVGFFFNAALVSAALERLRGGDPTLGSALAGAWARVGTLFGYALIAATVGLILRAIEERVGWVGRIVVGLLGVAWTLATFLVVPVLVAEGTGPLEAVKRSASLLGKTWGENLIGNAGIGLGFVLLYVLAALASAVLIGAAAQLGGTAVLVAVVACVAGFVLLITAQAALSAIYCAALYRYAADGQAPAAFGGPRLAQAFQPKLIS